MRIGFISYDFFPPQGGQGVEAYQLYRRLIDHHGMDLGVVSGCDNRLEGHVCLPAGKGPVPAPLGFSLTVNRRLPGLVSSRGFDALQVYGGPGGVMLLRKAGVPVIYVANHTYAQQERFLKKRIYRVLAAAEKVGYAGARHIVAISSTTARSLVDDYGVPASKVTVIPVGVDTAFFKPLDVEEVEQSMLFVGRLCKRKGIPVLLEAGRLIREEIPGFKLYIIGEGELRGDLEGYAGELGLQGCVSFLGKLADEDLPLWYNRASVFCLPSLFEGFGIVCLEAMACGTPVLASRAPGIVDVIPEERGELMFEPGDARELAGKAVSLLADAERRRSLGDSLRRRAREMFDWDIIASKFVRVYEEELHV